jgi:hypothetical protein
LQPPDLAAIYSNVLGSSVGLVRTNSVEFSDLNDNVSSAITDFMQDRAMLTAAHALGRGMEIDN